MINKTWLKISCFIPIYGTVINLLILFIQYIRERAFSLKKIILGMITCAVSFPIGFIISALLCRVVYNIAGLPKDNMQIPLLISFILSGLIMNIVLLIYYKKVFEK